MPVTLNSIAEDLAFSLGDQFNFTLREAIKNTVCEYRAKLLREEDYNHTLNRNDFTQTIVLSLEDYIDDLGNKHKITKDSIPNSIRFKSRGRVHYNYVGGELLNQPFNQTDFTEYEFIKSMTYQMVNGYYVIKENKIIVLEETKRCNIAITGVFEDPRDLINVCENLEQVDDDSNFPLSKDLISTIKKGILSGHFPIRQLGEKDVIMSNSNKEN